MRPSQRARYGQGIVALGAAKPLQRRSAPAGVPELGLTVLVGMVVGALIGVLAFGLWHWANNPG